jgi:hypothetical protein
MTTAYDAAGFVTTRVDRNGGGNLVLITGITCSTASYAVGWAMGCI